MLPWQTSISFSFISHYISSSDVAVADEKYSNHNFFPLKMRFPAAICSDLRDVNSSLCIGYFCT